MYEYFVQNAALAQHTTYRIGGSAKYLAFVYDLDGLLRALELSENRLILGRGSKVLVSDEGFDGVAIVMRFSSVKYGGEGLDVCGFGGGVASDEVYAEAGVSLPVLSRIFAAKELTGLEWASGIPANIGGALRLNAGAFGGDMSGIVRYVDVLRKGRIVRLSKSECGFAYRFSGFYPSDIILGAGFRVAKGVSAIITERVAEYTRKRSAAQPKGYSCGSVFKAVSPDVTASTSVLSCTQKEELKTLLSKGGNYDTPIAAYKFIQACGLKGLTVGGAQISVKHGNFIVNSGKATARDVHTLIRTIKAEVFIRFGVKLKEEVIYVGEF